jgi:thymidylate kinase
MKIEQRYPRVIVFFGPDGAGKSTQARLLIGYLKDHKRRPHMAWMRGRHSLAFILAELFTRLGYYRVVKSPSGVAYKVFDPRLIPKLRRVWGFIEFASVLPWIIQRVYLPRVLGYTVVAERYVVDTVVYLGYWLGPDFLRSFLAKVLLNFIPRSSILIHVDAETKLLVERRPNDIITKDYIVFQRRVYRMFAELLGAVTLNTSTRSVKQNFQQLIRHLNVEHAN